MERGDNDGERDILVEKTRKVLRALQMEATSARLRVIHKSCIPYSKFIKISQNKLMPLLTTLAHRFLHVTKISSPVPHILLLWSFSPLLRRHLQHHPIIHPALPPRNRLDLLAGDCLIEWIHGLNPDRICLQWLSPSPPPPPITSMKAEEGKEEIMMEREMSMEETRKVLRATQMEVVRARLRVIQKSCIPYSEFVKISQNKLMPLLTTLARRFIHIAPFLTPQILLLWSSPSLLHHCLQQHTASPSLSMTASSNKSTASTQATFTSKGPHHVNIGRGGKEEDNGGERDLDGGDKEGAESVADAGCEGEAKGDPEKMHSLLGVCKDIIKQTHAASHSPSKSLPPHRQAFLPCPKILPLRSSPSLLRRRLQHHPIVCPALLPPDHLALLVDDCLIKRIHGLNLDRICIEGPAPPPLITSMQAEKGKGKIKVERGISVEETRKMLRVIQKSYIPYLKFVKISQNKLMPLLTTLARYFSTSPSFPPPPPRSFPCGAPRPSSVAFLRLVLF